MTHASGPARRPAQASGSAVAAAESNLLHPDRGRAVAGTLREQLADGDLVTVTVLAPTAVGGWRAHPLPAHRFLAAVDNADGGVQPLPCPSDTAESADAAAAHSKQPFLADYLAVDLATLRPAPWSPGTAIALADACTRTGRMHPRSPRRALEACTHGLDTHGIRATIATHVQFHIDGTANTDGDSGLEAVLAHLCSLLHRADLPVESIVTARCSHPARHDAVTATFAPCDPLTACDNHIVLRHALATHARHHGFRAAFTPTDALTLRLAVSPYVADAVVSRTDVLTLEVPAIAGAVHQTAAMALSSTLRGTASRGSGSGTPACERGGAA